MVKPIIATQLLDEVLNPKLPPLTVTEAPGAAVKTMGAVEVPERATVTASW
jgi:hypothetical protein